MGHLSRVFTIAGIVASSFGVIWVWSKTSDVFHPSTGQAAMATPNVAMVSKAISTTGLQQKRQQVKAAEPLVQNGDLILRTGSDLTSDILRQFSATDKTYSHCGIAAIENGKVVVYHSIGGEDNPDAKLRRESFEQFCNPANNLGFGIFRYDLSPAQLQAVDSLARVYYTQQVPFDMGFSLDSDDRFYCAEFVYKTVNRIAGKDYIKPTVHQGFTFVAAGNLYQNGHAQNICKINF